MFLLRLMPVAGLFLAATPALAAHAARHSEEQSIPFASRGGIWDWRAQSPSTLYVQDSGRQWYRADLMGDCMDLPFEDAIRFELNPDGSFDRFSSISADGQTCPLRSLVRVDSPDAP